MYLYHYSRLYFCLYFCRCDSYPIIQRRLLLRSIDFVLLQLCLASVFLTQSDLRISISMAFTFGFSRSCYANFHILPSSTSFFFSPDVWWVISGYTSSIASSDYSSIHHPQLSAYLPAHLDSMHERGSCVLDLSVQLSIICDVLMRKKMFGLIIISIRVKLL